MGFWTFGTPRATGADGHTYLAASRVATIIASPPRPLRAPIRTLMVVGMCLRPGGSRWQTAGMLLPGDRLGPSRIALATQKPAAIAGIGFADLTSGMDEHGAPSGDEPAFA